MGGKKQTRARRAAAAAVAEDVPAGPARWLAAAERPQLAARAAAEMLSPVSSPPPTSSSAGDGLSEVRATSRKKDRRRGLPPGQPTVAQTVNRYECYEQSVQEPRKEISCIISIHRQVTMELSARRDVCASLPPPRVLREDFCGTAILSREWALRNVQNVAYGVDIDPAVVLYARERTLKDAKRGSVEDRVQLYVGDVLTCDEPPPSDIVAALNYGCSYFHRRVDLVRYLSRCVTNLRQPGGMIICDAFAGSATGARTKATRNGWFTSYFEHKSLNVMTNVVKTALHFRFDDGSWLKDAFSYDFRMYSIVELREALVEAGFKETFVWVSSTRARDNEVGSGLEDKSFLNEDEVKEVEVSPEEYVLADRYLPQMESYNAYIVGLT